MIFLNSILLNISVDLPHQLSKPLRSIYHMKIKHIFSTYYFDNFGRQPFQNETFVRYGSDKVVLDSLDKISIGPVQKLFLHNLVKISHLDKIALGCFYLKPPTHIQVQFSFGIFVTSKGISVSSSSKGIDVAL